MMGNFSILKRYVVLAATALLVWSCTASASDPQPDPDPGTTDPMPARIEAAAASLTVAQAARKIVKSLKIINYNHYGGGYLLYFTDGSSASLQNGDNYVSGVTPSVTIDDEGYWCASYDGGATYEQLADTAYDEGVGNGVGLRVVVESDSRYGYELFAPATPQTVTRRIATSYTPNAASVLQSIVQDDHSKRITLTLINGQVFEFNLEATYPTEIAVQQQTVVLPAQGEAQFGFTITPADARFTPVLTGEGANLRLSKPGSSQASANCRLTAVRRAVNAEGKTLAGTYIATVEDLGLSAEYSEEAVLVLTTLDSQGRTVQLTSPAVTFHVTTEPYLLGVKIGDAEAVLTDETVFHIRLPYGTNVKTLKPEFTTNGARVELNGSANITTVDFSSPVTFDVVAATGATKAYTVVVHYSELPILYINTPERIRSKEMWVESCSIELWNAGEQNACYTDVQMKGRGNSTWTYEKKPYAIKLDKKAEVLGMPAHKRWVLLANFLDHTCMRNALAFEVARKLPGLAWTPRGRFVEVVMNGVLQGNYYLCEQIKIDENRVNITKIEPTDIAGEALTGGYLMELDTNYDEEFKFTTYYYELPVQFKDPDEAVAPEQFNYMKDYFETIGRLLVENSKSDEVFDYIDIDSFIDWYLVNNIALNFESKHPKSFYMNKDRNGKLKAGPVWDFDYGTFVPSNEGLILTDAVWYGPLFKNKSFVKRLKERWTQYKPQLEQLVYFMDDTAAEIKTSAEANILLWPNTSFDFINGDTTLSFTEAVARLKQGYRQRLEATDKAINDL